MAKTASKPATAPKQAPKAEPQKKKEPIKVIQTGEFLDKLQNKNNTPGLSPDGIVTALNGLKGMIHDNPNAAEYYGLTKETVQGMNKLTVIGFATVLAIEVESGNSKFAIKMLENQPEAINALSEFTGVSINTKALPAPENGVVEVTSDKIITSKETKEKIKKEKEAKKDAVLNPTKIENDEMLQAALIHIISDLKEANPYDRVNKAISFYTSVLEFQASKAKDKDAKLAEIRATSRATLLRKIVEIAGPIAYSLEGIWKILRLTVRETKSPISAFCLFRNSSISAKTSNGADDNLIAEIVKILITWSCETAIAEEQKKIAESERVKKKHEGNVGIVNAENEKIEKFNGFIKDFKDIIENVNNPNMEIADTLVDAYNDEKHENHALSHRIFDNICSTYYKNVDLSNVDKDILLKNVQQYAGIILNMFNDPLSQSKNYKEANLVDVLSTAKTPAEEEKK